MGGGRRKKRRVAAPTPQDEEEARRRFLEALEAQRANARSQETEKTAENRVSPPPAAPLPGFYYDETKRRYFRSSPESERRQHEKIELQQLKQQKSEQKPEIQVKTRRRYGFNGHNWVDYMAQRQSDFAWSARGRDGRELIPQLLSGFLSSQVVESQDVHNDGRLTALALHPRASNLGAIGASSGRLDIFGLQRLPPAAGSASASQCVLQICNFKLEGVITSLEWRPVQELDMLVCQLGSGPRNNSQKTTGSVCFLRVGDQETRGVALVSTARMKQIKCLFIDPWTAKWLGSRAISSVIDGIQPILANLAWVVAGKHSVCLKILVFLLPGSAVFRSTTAAYADTEAQTPNLKRAPSGVITSDVHAQSFFSTGDVVLNGTKSGGLWGWDLRTPRRIFEFEGEATSDQPAGTVLDIHVLYDCRRAVVQRSNGELRMLDLRTLKPVVEFMPGAPKRYLPNLRCAIDSYESVVIAGGDAQRPLAVNSFGLQDGRCVSSVEVQNNQRTEKRSTLVQQVQLKSGHYGSHYENTPEIWALSRNELYICSGQTDDPKE